MRYLLLLVTTMLGCEGTVAEPSHSRPGGTGVWEGQLPRSADRSFRLTPVGITPGQSNVPTSGLMPFGYTGVLGATTRSLIESQAYLVSSGGLKTSIKVVVVPPARASDRPSLQLEAAMPLAADTWHWLIVEQTAELRVAGAEKQQAWKTHFFTGSAPRVVRLRASTAKNPDIVNVTFSEPVNAATLSASTLFVGAGTSGTCVLRGAACMDQSQPFLTHSVDVRLSAKFAPTDATVILAGSVAGSGRSVAAAAGLTGDPYSGGSATLAVAASAWLGCGDSTTYCWEDAKDLAVSP